MGEKCNKHDEVMNRLFNEITEIQKNNVEIKTKMDLVIAFKDSIHEIIFGNGKEGIKDKVARLCNQATVQWTLIVLIIGSVVGYFIRNIGAG